MKFIEINNKTCVNVDEICWVLSSEDGLSCTVCVGEKEYSCDTPYNSFVMIIQQGSIDKGHDNFHFAG